MYRLVHNGMKVKFFDKVGEINSYIDEVLKKNSNLNPRLIYNYKIGESVFMCYRYDTIYCEMFLIESEGDDIF